MSKSKQLRVPVSQVEKTRTFFWLFLIVLGLVWGFVTGASFFAGLGVAPATALFGVFAIIALAVTLVASGRDKVSTDWVDDSSMTAEETLARFEALNPEPTVGSKSEPANKTVENGK